MESKQFIGGGFPGIYDKKDIKSDENIITVREFSLKNILPIESILPKRKQNIVKKVANAKRIRPISDNKDDK